MSTEVMALNDDWLSTMAQTLPTMQVEPITTNCISYTPASYPSWIYPITVSTSARPIKLTLREVERLRTAAKKDDTLRRILEKFTPQIEVAVSFEE
jgi:hypothetical protein